MGYPRSRCVEGLATRCEREPEETLQTPTPPRPAVSAPTRSRRGPARGEGCPIHCVSAKRVLRSDIYLEAMKELGVKITVAEEQKITLFDGVFDGKDPEKYAKSFAIHSLAG